MTYNEAKTIVENRLIKHTDDTPFEELSIPLFGEQFGESEVRRRMWGMWRMIQLIEGKQDDETIILSLSDLHIPFQLDYGILDRHIGVDVLQLNGDIIDCQSLSKFPKTYRVSPMEEIIQGKQYLIDLIEFLKPSKVVCNYGNHDKRFVQYFSKKLDTDILELMPNTSLELIFNDGFRHYDKRNGTKVWYEPLKTVFDQIEICFVDNWWCQIGKTIFAHPMAYRSGILATADRAKQYFQDTAETPFDTIVMAHTHKIGDSMIGRIRLLEQGAFADVKQMNYMDGKLTPPQKAGYAVIVQDNTGSIIHEKSRVIMV